VDWSVVAHPKTNKQVERGNDMILQGLEPCIFKRLEKFRARWVAELSSVLWSRRTTPFRATGFTSFFMVHDSKAVPYGHRLRQPTGTSLHREWQSGRA
jgi:hypothetical protein